MLFSLLSLKDSSVLLNLYAVLSFKGFERSELAGTESSWFVWFKTAQHSYVPLLPLLRNSPAKLSPTFSVRPRS